MAALGPNNVRLVARLPGRDLLQRVPQVLALARAAGLPELVELRSPMSGRAQPLGKLDPGKLVDEQIRFDAAADDYKLFVSARPNTEGTLVQAAFAANDLSEERRREALHGLAALLRGLFETGAEEGTVERLETGLDALARPSLALTYAAVVVSDAQVAAVYREPDVFFAGWDEHLTRGDRHFLSRALDAATTAAWLKAVFAKQWAMARAARVGSVKYGKKTAPQGCEPIVLAGDARLTQVGIRDGHVELAASVPTGAEIPPWEILHWNEIIARGKLSDGSKVSQVRAAFRDEQSARRHARPLIGIGMQVVYLGRDGAYHAVDKDV